MENLPLYLHFAFGAITLISIFIFYKAAGRSRFALLVLTGWLLLTGIVGLSGFFADTSAMPPRLLLLVGPPLAAIIGLFVTPGGRHFIDRLDLKTLTLLHVVRIPVELVLLGLFLHQAVPQLMTFEGRNFDILSGITALFVFLFGFKRQQLPVNFLIAWNFICLGLLVNIVSNAVLAAPYPFQQFAFDQPNVGVLYFPFIWLPGIVVPLVLLSHLASIRQLMTARSKKSNKNFAEALSADTHVAART